MKKLLFSAVLFLGVLNLSAQPTWSEDAAQVFYDNCTVCHNPEGIGEFSLMTYGNALANATDILASVQGDEMPPWTADSSFQHYSQERILTQVERDIIIDWVNNGAVEGDPVLAPPAPIYTSDQILPGAPDLTIEMLPYMSKATATSDDYICIALPTGLVANRKVKAIEVIPGNRAILHHCLVFKDPTAAYVTDTIGGDCGGPSSGNLMGGYTPGATPTVFPETANFSAGMELEAGSNLIFAMHYPEGSYGEWDQTKVNIYFYDEPVVNYREIFAEPIIQDWSFTILANTVDSSEVSAGPIPADYTVLSAFPHMHLLGQFIETYAVTLANDTIPFVRIPEWDFEWQDFYWFQYMQHVPIGSTIHGKCIWSNLAGPENPNDPPVDITAGLNTSDEMFLIYYHYMAYQAGDENINVDSINTAFLGLDHKTVKNDNQINLFPNPFNEEIVVEYILDNPSFVSLYIYDLNGKLVNKLVREKQDAGLKKVVWNGAGENGEIVPAGLYYYSMMIDGIQFSGKIMKQ